MLESRKECIEYCNWFYRRTKEAMLFVLMPLVLYLHTSFGFIEIVNDRGLQDNEFRLTCRDLSSHIAIFDAKFTSLPDKDYLSVNISNLLFENFNIRLALNQRCSGRNHCSFVLHDDCPGAHFWGPGEISIQYACMPEEKVRHFCNQNIKIPTGGGADAQGFITNPGYPKYYIGHSECSWRIQAPENQKVQLTLLDVSLSGENSSIGNCEDELIVSDDDIILKHTCEEIEEPLVVLSQSNVIDVQVIGRTGSLVPKRGVLLHYRAIGCPVPQPPVDGYFVNGNQSVAVFMCCVGFVFPDTMERTRRMSCLQNLWDSTLPTECIYLQNSTLITGQVKSKNHNMSEESHLIDVVIPSLLIAGLLCGNAVIVFIIYKYKKKKTLDIHEEELSTMVADSTNVP